MELITRPNARYNWYENELSKKIKSSNDRSVSNSDIREFEEEWAAMDNNDELLCNELLLIFINNNFDTSSSADLSKIKSDLKSILNSNINVNNDCIYEWCIIIIKKCFNDTIALIDTSLIQNRHLCDSYYKYMDTLIVQFSIELELYSVDRDLDKNAFINNQIFISNVVNIQYIFTFINRYYFKMFNFNNIQFFKDTKIKANKFINTINERMIAHKLDDKQCNYLKLALSTFDSTLDHTNYKMSTFIGCVLTKYLCKDLSLFICEYI